MVGAAVAGWGIGTVIRDIFADPPITRLIRPVTGPADFSLDRGPGQAGRGADL